MLSSRDKLAYINFSVLSTGTLEPFRRITPHYIILHVRSLYHLYALWRRFLLKESEEFPSDNVDYQFYGSLASERFLGHLIAS